MLICNAKIYFVVLSGEGGKNRFFELIAAENR